ncbi:sodium:solute symporter [Pseudonocardia nigra]|uniref:sodium:solute symporter n=1 Tax=Pseudonocardia nigra TaxID=1921578 RepID=UPI001FE82260|nr:sodium:solute symporter [Pseudonocardia nigra]
MGIDAAVIGLYLLLMLAAGWWGLRRARSSEDFLLAGRRLGPVLYAGTMSAVVLGGASTIGGVRLGYLYGISGMWLVLMLGLGLITLSAAFARKLSRMRVYTLPEMLERRYNAPGRLIGGLVMTAYDLMVAVTATLAIGTVVDVLLGVPRIPAILVGGGIVVVYSVLGGMWSITITDMLQFVIMTIGIFAVLLPVGLRTAGGLDGLRGKLPGSAFDLTAIGGGTITTYFLIYFFGIIIGQDIWQRVFTARDARVATVAGVGAGVYCILYAVAGAVIGMCAAALYPGLENPDKAFATIADGILPVGIKGLVLAAALAAVMSTASACLLASSTILANDVYGRAVRGEDAVRTVGENRVWTLACGAVMVVLAVLVQDVVAALTVAYNLLVGALLVPVVGALLWRRGTSTGALAAMCVGSVVVVALMATQGLLANEPIYYGLAASAATFVVVSLLTPATDPTRLAAWDRRLRGEQLA